MRKHPYRTISISLETYNLIKAQALPGESFDATLRRLVGLPKRVDQRSTWRQERKNNKGKK